MHIRTYILVLLMTVAAALPSAAASSSADAPHVHVQLVVPPTSLQPGQQAVQAGLYFKLESGWHVYWKNAGDAGEPPRMKWTLPDGISASPIEFPAPHRLPLGPLMDFGYEDEVLFPFQLTVAPAAKAGPAVLHTRVNWLVCQASCIPGHAELEVTRDIGAGAGIDATDAALLKRLSGKLPKTLPSNIKATFEPTKDGFRLFVATGQKETQGAFFPSDQDVIHNPAPQTVIPSTKGLVLELKKDENLTATPAQINGVIELSGGRAYEIAALPGAVAGGSATIAAVAPVATAATALASAPSATPPPSSAAPTLAATPPATTSVSSAAKKPSPAPLTGIGFLRATGLAFLGGLLLNLMPCVFPVLFLKGLSLVNSGNEERGRLRAHGFVYAIGILASFWLLVGALLGLRAAGSTLGWGFQFQSPVFLGLMAGLLFFLGLSLAGQFEIGLTLTSAGGSLAQKQGFTGSFFTGVLAVIVATPCTAPFMGAAVGYALAQSAAVTFAVFTALALGLAAPYVALTLQPAWTRLLPRPGAWMEVLRQAVAVPIFATAIWLAWVLVRAYGADMILGLLSSFLLLAIAGWFLGRWPAKRWSTSVAGVIVVGVIAVCVVGPKIAANEINVTVDVSSGSSQGHGWEPWSELALTRYRAQHRPVFVDFTASWCLSCQVNERIALNQPAVQKALQDDNVALLKADWTRGDDAITAALAGLDRSGVPAYALYVPGEDKPRLLPEALTSGIVLDALSGLPKTAAITR